MERTAIHEIFRVSLFTHPMSLIVLIFSILKSLRELSLHTFVGFEGDIRMVSGVNYGSCDWCSGCCGSEWGDCLWYYIFEKEKLKKKEVMCLSIGSLVIERFEYMKKKILVKEKKWISALRWLMIVEDVLKE